jgi:hypothetical protein
MTSIEQGPADVIANRAFLEALARLGNDATGAEISKEMERDRLTSFVPAESDNRSLADIIGAALASNR